ncbi:MAG TPA: hypothetical protein VGE45_03445 [Chloroflexia bacterium]
MGNKKHRKQNRHRSHASADNALYTIIEQGRQAAKAGHHSEAQVIYEQAIELVRRSAQKKRSEHANLWLEMAELHACGGRVESARALYKEYLVNALLDGRASDFQEALTASTDVAGIDLNMNLVSVLKELKNPAALELVPASIIERAFDEANIEFEVNPSDSLRALIYELSPLALNAKASRVNETQPAATGTDVDTIPQVVPPLGNEPFDIEGASTTAIPPIPPSFTSVAENSRQAALTAIWKRRVQGTINYRGSGYGIRAAIYYMLTMLEDSEGIARIELEGIEDFDVYYKAQTAEEETPDIMLRLYVQVKSRDSSQPAWSIAELRDEGVITDFAEVHCKDPKADFLFITDHHFGEQTTLSGVLDYANLGEYDKDKEHSISANVRSAITIGSKELEEAHFDLNTFLQRIHFRQLPRDLDPTIIEKLAKRFGCPRAVAGRYYDAIFKKVYELAEADKKQDGSKSFSKTDLERFLSEIIATVDLSALEGPLRRGNLELLTFGVAEEAQPAPDPSYYLGVYADVRHILANQDIVRPELMAQIAAKLVKSNFCVIRSPSGSGKTTLMYRFAYEHRLSFAVYRVRSLEGPPETIADAVRYIQSLQPSEQSPVLLLIDSIMRPEKRGWQDLVKPLLEHPAVYVLATTREDEWRDVEASDINVEYVTLALSEDTAYRFHKKLKEHGQLHPDYPDWREAYEMSKTNNEALFMEYAHILTQGKRIEEVLREQVERLQRQASPDRKIQMRLLRVICTAHAFGGRVPAVALPSLISVEAEELTSHLGYLANEHLIIKEQDYYLGLHEVRSQFLRDITHEFPPPALRDTLRLLVEQLPLEELAPILESVCKDRPDAFTGISEAVGLRLSRDGKPAIIADILRRLFIASEWHHAQKVKIHADLHGINPNEISILGVALAPAVPALMSSLNSTLFRVQFRAALTGAPARSSDRFERLIAPYLDINALAATINSEPDTAKIVYLLNWLNTVDADMARKIVDSADIDYLATLVRTEMSGQRAASVLFHVWRSSEAAYRRLLDTLGGQQFLIEKLIATYPLITQIDLSSLPEEGDVVHVRFYAEGEVPELGSNATPHSKTIFLAETAMRMFPTASRIKMNGLFATGAPYKMGIHDPTHKDMPVENLTPLEDVEKTRIWTRALAAQYTVKTWFGYLQQQDELRELYLDSLSNLAKLLEGTRLPNPRLSASYMARVASYVTKARQLQTQSRMLFWPPDQHGAIANPEHAARVYSDIKSVDSLQMQLLSGQYYREPDKDADADGYFRNYTSAIDRCGAFLQAFLVTGEKSDLSKLKANLASALSEVRKFQSERKNLLLRQAEHESLSAAELRLMESIYKAVRYVFENGYKGLWAEADTLLSRIQLLTNRLVTMRQEMSAGAVSPPTRLAQVIVDEVASALPTIGMFAQLSDALRTARLSRDNISQYIEQLSVLTLLDCFVALAEHHYERLRAAQLRQIEADLRSEGLNVTFGPAVVKEDTLGMDEETLPIIFEVSNLTDMLTKGGSIFRRIFAERFEYLQGFAIVITDGEAIVWPVIRTFSYSQISQWRVVEHADPNSFLGLCMARHDLVEQYSTHLGIPIAEDSQYLQSLKIVYNGLVTLSMRISELREDVRQERKGGEDIKRFTDLPLDELIGVPDYMAQVEYFTRFEPEQKFEPFHVDVRNLLVEWYGQIEAELEGLRRLVTNDSNEDDTKGEGAPTLAEMFLETVAASVRSGSILQSAEEVKVRLAAAQNLVYAEIDPAAKFEWAYLALKNYFHFGITEYSSA